MLSRSVLRQKCMTILYQIDIMKQNELPYDVEEIIKENLEIENDFVKDIVFGVETSLKEIDEIANKYLRDWDIKRLDKAGSAILRMAIYEMKYMDTPPVVVINEAIELAKKYTDEELVSMINAVLDKFMKDEM